MMTRHRRLAATLAVLAILSQLFLPMLHASSWARDNGDARLYAFCGTGSPEFLAKLREVSPQLDSGAQDHGQRLAEGCPLCLTVAAVASALMAGAVCVFALQRRSATAISFPRLRRLSVAMLRPYQSRAPPALSCAF